MGGPVCGVFCGLGQMVHVAPISIVVAVGGRWEAVLAIRTRWGTGSLDRRRRRLAEGRVQVVMVVLGQLRLIVDICVVDQRDVVHEVVDEKLGMCHEVVDGVPGLRLLDAVIEGATECFHHPHLSERMGCEEGERERDKKKKKSVICRD